MNKYLKYGVIGLVMLLLQLTVADWIRIQEFKPDLMMLFVLYLAYREGRSAGVLYGFLFGLITDLSTASAFLGLSPLVYSVVGFGAGCLRGRFHTVNPILLYLVGLAVVFLGHFLYFGIYYSGSPLNPGGVLSHYTLPAFLYTGLVGTLVLFILPVSGE